MDGIADHNLRLASESDLEFLVEVLAMSAYSSLEGVLVDRRLSRYLQNWMQPEDFGVLAIDRRGNQLGGAFVRLFESHTAPYHFVERAPYELILAVKHDFRGKGLGRELLREVTRAADERGVPLSLNVREGNPAVNSYLTAGFNVLERIPNRAGSTSLVMVREPQKLNTLQ